MSIKSILCIPGCWADFEEFHQSLIVSSAGGYLVVGNILISGKRKRQYLLEFCERDPKMKRSFSAAGAVTGVTEEFLDEIDKHQYVIYISAETGNLEEAEHIAHAGHAILQTGGIGLKVESTGKAFTKNGWQQHMFDFELPRLYEMFVIDSIVDKEGTVFSCGMHNLGLRDTIVYNEEFKHAVELIKLFGYYQIMEKPVLTENQTFKKSPGSPLFRITNELHAPYANNKIFGNPFGMWRLTRMG